MPVNKRQLWAVVIPFLGLFLWTLSVALSQSQGTSGRIKIVGYDPIDLLSGHYLRFRYDLGPMNPCLEDKDSAPAPVCACVTQSLDGVFTTDRRLQCDEAKKLCQTYIEGSCRYGNFLTGSERFYFPETYAPVLRLVPDNSFAEVSLHNGAVALQNIFVGPIPILDYAKGKLAEPKP